MGDYYNTTRGPLSVTLNDGSSCAVSPKSWIYVTPANESSASITKLVQKGFLARSTVARTVEAPPAPVSEPTSKPEVAAPPPAKMEIPEAKASAPTSSMKEDLFRKKR